MQDRCYLVIAGVEVGVGNLAAGGWNLGTLPWHCGEAADTMEVKSRRDERFYFLERQYLTHAAALFSICIRHSRDGRGWGDGEGAWI